MVGIVGPLTAVGRVRGEGRCCLGVDGRPARPGVAVAAVPGSGAPSCPVPAFKQCSVYGRIRRLLHPLSGGAAKGQMHGRYGALSPGLGLSNTSISA